MNNLIDQELVEFIEYLMQPQDESPYHGLKVLIIATSRMWV